MTSKIMCVVFLIFFLIGCDKNESEESEKYKLVHRTNERYLKLFDDNGTEILFLQFDEKDSIASIAINNYKGFTLSAVRYDEKLHAFHITDTKVKYQNTTHLNIAEDILIDTYEFFDPFSKKYQLLDDGRTKIEHGDYINEVWISEEEFEKQFE